jgi:hypothetical protein
MDFLNTISQGVAKITSGSGCTDNKKKYNVNILIGNTNVAVKNQNLRNNGSFNNKK